MRAVASERTLDTQPGRPASAFSSVARLVNASAGLSTSLGRLLSPVLDLLTRLWLAQGFLVTDVMQHMLPADRATGQEHPSLLVGIASTGLGILIQTICPVLLAAGLFTRVAAAALLVQVLVLRLPGHTQLAPYSAALLGWVVVLGPGPLSLDGMFRSGMNATALPFVRPVSLAVTALTQRFGPIYNLLLRLWIAAAPVAIAFGGVQALDNALPAGMGMALLPRMSGMTTGLAPWVLLTLAAALPRKGVMPIMRVGCPKSRGAGLQPIGVHGGGVSV